LKSLSSKEMKTTWLHVPSWCDSPKGWEIQCKAILVLCSARDGYPLALDTWRNSGVVQCSHEFRCKWSCDNSSPSNECLKQWRDVALTFILKGCWQTCSNCLSCVLLRRTGNSVSEYCAQPHQCEVPTVRRATRSHTVEDALDAARV
jgi:hypothetical protein